MKGIPDRPGYERGLKSAWSAPIHVCSSASLRRLASAVSRPPATRSAACARAALPLAVAPRAAAARSRSDIRHLAPRRLVASRGGARRREDAFPVSFDAGGDVALWLSALFH